jgi:di/tripeptidase
MAITEKTRRGIGNPSGAVGVGADDEAGFVRFMIGFEMSGQR